jgi:hypothetical protein
MIPQRFTELHGEQPFCRKMISDRRRLADRALHEGLESASTLAYIYDMNDHFMRSLGDRYEVIYD